MPPDPPSGALSLDEVNRMITKAPPAGGAAPGRPDNRVYSPNPDAPVPPGMVRGGPEAPAGALSLDHVNSLMKQAPPEETFFEGKGHPGMAHSYLEGLNQVVAETLGIPGSAAAHLIAPKLWNDLPEEKRAELRRSDPRQSAFMDYLSRSSDTVEKQFGGTAVKGLFDKIGITGKGNEPVTRRGGRGPS